MDKASVEKTIAAHWFEISEDRFGPIAEAIAEAHEADKWDALDTLKETWHDIELDRLREIDQLKQAVLSLEARLAVMAEALAEIAKAPVTPSACLMDVARLARIARQALAAAPKVLFAGEMDLLYSDSSPCACILPGPLVQLTTAPRANVIVLECSEHRPESEQE